MKVTLIEFGKENQNGRIYLHHEVSELPKQMFCSLDILTDQYKIPVFDVPLNGDSTCGFADISMDQEGIYAEVRPFSDARGQMFNELMMNGYKIEPLGTGSLNEKNEVEDYRLHYVFLMKNEE